MKHETRRKIIALEERRMEVARLKKKYKLRLHSLAKRDDSLLNRIQKLKKEK